nr:MAG TPA: hypothetical protein [Caudoviricetes sp.]
MFFNKYKKHRENSQCFKLCYTLAGCTIAGDSCQCKLYVELLLNPNIVYHRDYHLSIAMQRTLLFLKLPKNKSNY